VARGVSNCSYFGIYDGHGGSFCADYLRDKLHSHLFASIDLKDPANSIRHCLQMVDQEVLDKSIKDSMRDSSGSCVLGALIFGSRHLSETLICSFSTSETRRQSSRSSEVHKRVW
jgi:serine/threonine protein phosphatase PrpC